MFEIIITTSFIGFHKWEDAPDQFAYLRDLHRHTFTVRAEKVVGHADRDIEFIDLKDKVDQCITTTQMMRGKETEKWSCEHWAEHIGQRFDFDRVEVMEDGENGARWTR